MSDDDVDLDAIAADPHTADPKFERAERVHDWRNHVPHALQALWPRMSGRERAVAVYIAKIEAANEEWE